jgi:predicted RNase H-like HicB family nuclease
MRTTIDDTMSLTFTAYVELDPETNLYVGTVPGLAGAHSQGATLDELQHNLREVIELVLEERKARGEPIEIEPFVGIQQVNVTV